MKLRAAKRVAALFLTVLLSITGTLTVSADSLLDEIEATETLADYAEDTSYSLLRGNNLNFGTTKISKLSSYEINVYGMTQCHRICDTAYLSLYLERKVGGSYATYKQWDFTDTNTSQLNASINVIVPSGYYYRVRGYHAAKDGGVKESTTTLTQGVLVN